MQHANPLYQPSTPFEVNNGHTRLHGIGSEHFMYSDHRKAKHVHAGGHTGGAEDVSDNGMSMISFFSPSQFTYDVMRMSYFENETTKPSEVHSEVAEVSAPPPKAELPMTASVSEPAANPPVEKKLVEASAQVQVDDEEVILSSKQVAEGKKAASPRKASKGCFCY